MTGVTPGEKAARLFKRIMDSPMLVAEGLHVYDGHINDPDLSIRQKKCNDSFLPVTGLMDELKSEGISSEMPHPRIKILGMEKYTFISHNEEHMVIRTTLADSFKTGDHLYCVPWHICPTVDRYDTVYVVNDHKVTGQWEVDARKRTISI